MTTKERILRLLRENARISNGDIAARLSISEKKVASAIAELEKEKIILGYTAVVNDLDEAVVRALIEVKVTPQRDGGFDHVAMRIARFPEVRTAKLVSGSYDLLIEVEGKTLQDVAGFVSAKLSSIDGVISCATSFQLKKYKEVGKIFENDEEDNRLKVSP
ncbi:MAG: Lrp/AsnC family transcriptional regulator [Victivallaceae bacterium]|nr:Lrp/AsnC family transcriptional regulator [Victivallaceae bacterium]